jgi:hypothetical protein
MPGKRCQSQFLAAVASGERSAPTRPPRRRPGLSKRSRALPPITGGMSSFSAGLSPKEAEKFRLPSGFPLRPLMGPAPLSRIRSGHAACDRVEVAAPFIASTSPTIATHNRVGA